MIHLLLTEVQAKQLRDALAGKHIGAEPRTAIRELVESAIDPINQAENVPYIEAARRLYARNSNDDIEVDDTAIVSEGDGGSFVSGWLYVRDEELPGSEDDSDDGEE